MKIVFVAFGYENIGIEYLSACLKAKGHTVSLVFDPGLFNTYHISNSFLAKAFNFKKRVIAEVLKCCPDIVAFSVLSDNYAWACELAGKLKEEAPALPIIFGGIHATSLPERVISNDFVDYVCIGEGEEAFLELLDSLEKKEDVSQILNIWSKKKGQVINNQTRPLVDNLDLLPLPDKLLFYQEYTGFTKNVYMTMSSRGCPYRCTYCYNSYLMELYKGKGKYLRQFSVERFIEELVGAKKDFSMRRISFVDDVFTSSEAWLDEFSREYLKKVNVPFGCLVHPLFVNENIVKILKKIGCTVVGMGIQTLNEQIKRDIINREESNETVKKVIRLFKEAGIMIYVDFIFGLPDESQKDAEDAVLFLSETKPDAVSSLWLRYYPQTEIINIGKEKNLLSSAEIEEINQSLVSSPVSGYGNAVSSLNKGLATLVLFSCNLSVRLAKNLLKYRWYRFLPKGNWHHLHTVIKQFLNKWLYHRDGTLYSSMSVHLKYYGTYIFRYFFKKKREV